MAFNIKGLLSGIAGLPNAIGEGLLGPTPTNPGLGIDPQSLAQARRQALSQMAMGFIAGDPRGHGATLYNSVQGAQQGYQGRVFDLLKESEAARMMEERQKRDAATAKLLEGMQDSPMMATLAAANPEAFVGEAIQAQFAPQAQGEKWRPLTPEEVRASRLDPASNWQVNEITGKIDKLYSPPAQTQVSVNLPPSESELGKALGKGAGEEFVGMSTAARGAVSTLEQLNDLEPLVSSPGFISGPLGETRLAVAKVLGLQGAEETQAYFAAVGRQVGENIKMFGAGTGLSDADREFAKQMAAGSIELTPTAIQRIMRINRKVSERVISKYNQRRTELAEPKGREPRPEVYGLYPELSAPSSGGVDALLDKYAPK